MPLTEQRLLDLIGKRERTESWEIRGITASARGRAELYWIEAGAKDGRRLRLLEKDTPSPHIPRENEIYRYYADKLAPIPACYHNEHEADAGLGVLVIEDLTATHESLADWNVPVGAEERSALIEAIARFHAASWEEQNQSAPDHLGSLDAYMQHLGYLERDYRLFRERQPYGFGAQEFELYEQSLAELRSLAPAHLERIRTRRHTALIHGDLNVGNILYPIAQAGEPCLIDLEAVRVGLGTEDLTMLFIHDLFHGSQETDAIFQAYHRALCQRIPPGYTAERFEEDRRLALLEGLFFPIKLFVHQGVVEEELALKSINAYRTR